MRCASIYCEQSRSISRKLRAQLRWLPVQAGDSALRGLYLWGGVGRGKTMLMDMFFESLRPSFAERTHFYRFMREIHAQLRTHHEARRAARSGGGEAGATRSR